MLYERLARGKGVDVHAPVPGRGRYSWLWLRTDLAQGRARGSGTQAGPVVGEIP